MIRTLALTFTLVAAPLAAETLRGPVTHVRDADTIEVAGVPIRLNGVDAPELGTPEGRRGKVIVTLATLGKDATCVLSGERNHDRWIGVCSVDGTDVGALAVSAGIALDCARYSGGRYRHLETAAARRTLSRASYC